MRHTVTGWEEREGGIEMTGSCCLVPTHLDEPLCQQVDSLSHSRVVFREKLDDMFWRATCLEIPATKVYRNAEY